MRSLIFGFFVLFVITISCTNRHNIIPEVMIPSELNLGEIFYGDTVRSSIVCKNIAEKKITVDYVRTPCGCIIAFPQQQTIKPGDSTTIKIVYKPMDFGYTEQHLFVFFREYEQPAYFKLKCNIKDKE